MEALRVLDPLRVADVVLIPVQRVRIEPAHEGGVVRVHASAEPRAIVVHAGGCWRALDPDGAGIALEPLLEEVTGLADAVERERRGGA